MVDPENIDAAFRTWGNRVPADVQGNVPVDDLSRLARLLFFASLGTEEGRATRLTIVWVPDGTLAATQILDADEYLPQNEEPQRAWTVVPIAPFACTVDSLIKSAPMVEFGRSALLICGRNGVFSINGVARRNRSTDGGRAWVLYTEGPGIVTLSFRLSDAFRYERGAAVEPEPRVLWKPGPVLDAILALDPDQPPYGEKNFLANHRLLAVSVIRTLADALDRPKHGGLILLTGTEPEPAELALVARPSADPAVLTEAVVNARRAHDKYFDSSWERARPPPEETSSPDWEEIELREASEAAEASVEDVVNDLGRLAAVDNAVLFGPGFRFLGLQFKVPSPPQPLRVEVASDVPGEEVRPYDMSLHGSRHAAAVDFTSRAKGRLALLSSSDGAQKVFLGRGDRVTMWRIRRQPF